MQPHMIHPSLQTRDYQKKTVYHDLYALKDETKTKENPYKRYVINLLAYFFSFSFPLYGFIVWILFRSDRPKDAIFPLLGVILGWLAIFVYRWIPLIYSILG